MLFNSYEFIFLFLPVTFLLYFLLQRLNLGQVAKIFLVASSLFFYSWWNASYLPLILISMLVNYTIGYLLSRATLFSRQIGEKRQRQRQLILLVGIIFNLGLLGYFKYADFLIGNLNSFIGTNFSLLRLALPLAISFITFQQIAFIVDAYRGETKSYNFLEYALFVTFFPQLIAGPIVYHKEMMPQFANADNQKLCLSNVSVGLFIFFMGLFKKAVIADTFAIWATYGFDQAETLTFVEAWLASLSYTFQLYFDFSGYTDMAIGAALLFNIRLPINFNSPYKALNIQDFWRRWHMTLGRFFTHYLYIPLGGNRRGAARTYINLLLVFLLSGLWHGAGWTFIVWGFLHGVANVLNRFWQRFSIKMPIWLAWFLTFQFVNASWVFFRARNFEDAWKVLRGMIGLSGGYPDGSYVRLMQQLENPLLILEGQAYLPNLDAPLWIFAWLLFFLLITLKGKNSVQWQAEFRPTIGTAIFAALLTTVSVLFLTRISEFLYFKF